MQLSRLKFVTDHGEAASKKRVRFAEKIVTDGTVGMTELSMFEPVANK